MTKNLEIMKKYKQEVIAQTDDFSPLFKEVENQSATGNGWVSGLCPFHVDTNPSFAFNTQHGGWCCFSRCGKGSPFDYLMQTAGYSFTAALFELGDRAKVPRPNSTESTRLPIRDTLVRQWALYLSSNDDALRWLHDRRGLTAATIKKLEIGWDPKRERYTIPVRDEGGRVVNVRLYSTKKKPKMINFTDGDHKYGSPPRLFGLDRLVKHKGEQVIICEGEWDAMLLQQEGFMAVTGTHGASTFPPEWIPYFNNKGVVILYDCDQPGKEAATRIVLPALKTSGAASVKNVALALKGSKDDKDVTDYLVKHGKTEEDLAQLIERTPLHSYEAERVAAEVINLSSFTEIEKEEYVDKKVCCEIAVCGETSEAFHAVETFRFTNCRKKEKGKCYDCRAVTEPETLPRSAQEYIGACMSSNSQIKSMLREYGCPHGEKPTVEIVTRVTVKEFFCHQKVNRVTQIRDEDGNIVQTLDGKQQELMEKKVYFLSSEHPKPGSYAATGWVKSHPKTQQITFLIESLTPLEDDFESFQVNENLEFLTAFNALSWREILSDLTDNVTRIYDRDDLLVAVLLTYCSPLWIPFNQETIRGWLATAIIGDAGTGKSQTAQRIAEFVNIGDFFSGLTGSRTGLAYALVEHRQKGWQVRVGRYPANSRKILIVDEVQFVRDDELRTISKAMEEGFLQIDRVQSKGYESMTRLIMMANPKRDVVMDHFTFGCQALASIFPPTIIRRTDIAVFANSGDLSDLALINKKQEPGKKRLVTPDMLRAVIFWAWNLKAEQIVWVPGAEDDCLERAIDLSNRYGFAVDVPLVTISDCRNNIARIAAAFAVLTVSTDEDFSLLTIDSQHVRMAAEFLCTVYDHENCNLAQHSEVSERSSQLYDYDRIKDAFLNKKEHEKHAQGSEPVGLFSKAIFVLRVKEAIKRDDLAEQVGCSVGSIKRIVTLLKRYDLLDSNRDGYWKTPKFNKFLKRFLKEHPDFLQDTEQGVMF